MKDKRLLVYNFFKRFIEYIQPDIETNIVIDNNLLLQLQELHDIDPDETIQILKNMFPNIEFQVIGKLNPGKNILEGFGSETNDDTLVSEYTYT